MINSEETIGKVLAGLRDAEASPGLERRILAAVEAHTSQRQAAKPFWMWGVAFAGVMAVFFLLAITAIYRHGQTPTQAQQHVLPAESAESTQEALLMPQKPIVPTRTPIIIATSARKAQPISAEQAVLLREMHAPSHPAPAAPLTKEEKLLLRAVHLGDPQVMAMLNPEVRARQEAESEAEFQKFVDQSGGDNE
ncbi:MAG: hypothetical protein ABSC77_13710 [Terracidiphilus sp.]|jgi:hypothetical protein